MKNKKIKTQMSIEEILIRIGISAVIILATFLIFFFGGGLNMFKSYLPKETIYSKDFEVHFIDVGQGDSTLIRLPDGKTMLIDCGEKSAGNTLVSYLTEVFNYNEVNAIDFLIFTHQDSDHIGSGKLVLDTFQVNCVYRPMQLTSYEINTLKHPNNEGYAVSSSSTYNNTIKAVYQEPDCEIKFSQAGETIQGENYKVNFLTPLSVSSSTTNNNYSPLIMLEYNGAKFLFTGDAEKKVENEAVDKYGNLLKADVYKAGHHGSNTSSSAAFLEKVLPEYTVISCGKDNSYGHPNSNVIDRLKNTGSHIMTTMELGTVIMSVDESGSVIILSHSTPNYDMTIVIAAGIILLLLTWGIKFNKKGNKTEEKASKKPQKSKKHTTNTKKAIKKLTNLK